MSDFLASFSDPNFVSQYAEGPPRFMPGFADMHRMTGVLLSEHAGENAKILVLGAGGGLELKALAEWYPTWTFTGVDPSEDMLELARLTLGPLSSRVVLEPGYIFDAPEGAYDAATCLLTLHFLSPEERVSTLQAIRQRLRPGAPLVIAHSSFPQNAEARPLWLSRYAAFAEAAGVDADVVEQAQSAVGALEHIQSPADDESLLEQAGFSGIELFYTAFTWRGWVAYA